MPQVNILFSKELVRIRMLPQARHVLDVLAMVVCCLASLEGGREGTVGLGRGSGVKN